MLPVMSLEMEAVVGKPLGEKSVKQKPLNMRRIHFRPHVRVLDVAKNRMYNFTKFGPTEKPASTHATVTPHLTKEVMTRTEEEPNPKGAVQ